MDKEFIPIGLMIGGYLLLSSLSIILALGVGLIHFGIVLQKKRNPYE